MMIVVVLVSGIALFSLPRFRQLNERSKMDAARHEIEAAMATARAAAIQKGRPSRFEMQGNQMLVWVLTGTGTRDTVIKRMPLDTLFKVSVAPDTSVLFDMRGWARMSGRLTMTLSSAAKKDTVCLLPTGQILPRGCVL
jgi:Tfp pilus assembly protein FimT